MDFTEPKDRIIVALDGLTIPQQLALVQEIGPQVGGFKQGLEHHGRRQALLSAMLPGLAEMFRPPTAPASQWWTRSEQQVAAKEQGLSLLRPLEEDIRALHALDECLRGRLFWDGKFHDIPTTVELAIAQLATLSPRIFNVHCLGGTKMMRAAVKAKQVLAEAAHAISAPVPLLFGVTVLTSHSYEDLVEMGLMPELNIADSEEAERVKQERMDQLAIRHLAWLAQENGFDGVICSPRELKTLRQYCGSRLLAVVAGVRPAAMSIEVVDDQARVMTVYGALRGGADGVVVGRPVTKPNDYGFSSSREAVDAIVAEATQALQEAA
jgi:orotidine-5'-phosphate decarboxylase